MKTKYQIFVSSTYSDLKEERDQVIKAILEMGHIPVGMEMFSAGDDEQWEIIKTQIDDCDYYVVIVAHRYGSMDGDISYTEKEYDYAAEKGIPTLGFVIDDKADWPMAKTDDEEEKKKYLNRFKEKVKNKLVSIWQDKNDLYGKVSISLSKQFTTNPQTGWTRANESAGPEVLAEVSRLSKENSNLRDKIEQLNKELNKEKKREFQNTIETLNSKEYKIPFYYEYGDDWENDTKFSLYAIFEYLAPEMMVEISTKNAAKYLGKMLNPYKDRSVRQNWPIPSNHLKAYLSDLYVLDLVKPSEKKHSVKDTNDYWTISEEGTDIYKAIRKKSLLRNQDTETYDSVIEMAQSEEK